MNAQVKIGRLVRWGLAAAWAAVIFGFSSIPGSSVPGRYGTLAHFTEYAILAVLIYAALRPQAPRVRAALLAIAIASLYGVTDEFHQSFVPMRVPDAADWAVDTAGAVTGVLLAALVDSWAGRRRSR